MPDDAVSALIADIEEDWEVSHEAATQMAEDYVRILDSVRNGTAFVTGFSTASNTTINRQEAVKFWLDSVFFRRDLPVVIRAKNGRGKTYLLSWLLLRARIMRPDGDFLTNIPWFWETDERVKPLAMPNFYNINSMSEMLRRSAESVLSDRIPYVIIDEMDNAVSSQDYRRGKESPYASWKQFTYIKRHLRMKGPILTYHSVNDIPNYMRSRQVVADILKVYVHGGERYIFSEATRPYSLKINGEALLYSKTGFNDFEINVDMRKLRIMIGKTGNPKETAKMILKHLDDCSFDAYERRKIDEEKEEKYRAVCELRSKDPKITYRKIAEKLGIKSLSDVKEAVDWCKEQKDNKKNNKEYVEDEENE